MNMEKEKDKKQQAGQGPKPHARKAEGLSMRAAFSYFLKGNRIFALNGIVLIAIDSIICLFPALFQMVYTDNIITRKNPEWYMPLLILYILLFVFSLAVWIAFSILRRKSMVRINITASANYLWTVLKLPMTRLTQFSPGELVARYTTIPDWWITHCLS